jgi:hypothetical protein
VAADEQPSSGDPLTPEGGGVIEVRIGELDQLFNSMDPSPFHEKGLDPDAEEYIVSSAKELPAAAVALVVYLDQPAGLPDESRIVGDAVRDHFGRRSELSRRELRQLFRRGGISLLIGLAFLAASVIGGEEIARRTGQGPLATVLRESLLIGGWVAMWRPMEIFLYDWWTLLGERRVYDRLGGMAVQIVYLGGAQASEPIATPPAEQELVSWHSSR